MLQERQALKKLWNLMKRCVTHGKTTKGNIILRVKLILKPISRFDCLDRAFYEELVNKGAIVGESLRFLNLTDDDYKKLTEYGVV